jgi:hypothetical protein
MEEYNVSEDAAVVSTNALYTSLPKDGIIAKILPSIGPLSRVFETSSSTEHDQKHCKCNSFMQSASNNHIDSKTYLNSSVSSFEVEGQGTESSLLEDSRSLWVCNT